MNNLNLEIEGFKFSQYSCPTLQVRILIHQFTELLNKILIYSNNKPPKKLLDKIVIVSHLIGIP